MYCDSGDLRPVPDEAGAANLGALSGCASWFAVRTLHLREVRAETQLLQQGLRTFLPKRLKTVRHARRLSTVVAPFFPNYLFVKLDLTRDRWRSVNGTFGVAGLVMQGDQPHPIPRGIVETLMASSDSRGLLRFERDLKVGGRVRLMAGPFAERLGILDRLDDSGRVRVLLEIMGGHVPVVIERDYVVATA
jgi:transcription antitermination factor NusG